MFCTTIFAHTCKTRGFPADKVGSLGEEFLKNLSYAIFPLRQNVSQSLNDKHNRGGQAPCLGFLYFLREEGPRTPSRLALYDDGVSTSTRTMDWNGEGIEKGKMARGLGRGQTPFRFDYEICQQNYGPSRLANKLGKKMGNPLGHWRLLPTLQSLSRFH